MDEQDYTTRDEYGNIAMGDEDVVQHEDVDKYLSDLLNQKYLEGKKKAYNNAVAQRRMLIGHDIPEDAYRDEMGYSDRDYKKIMGAFGPHQKAKEFQGVLGNTYENTPDGLLRLMKDEAIFAQLDGMVAEILLPFIGYHQQQAYESGQPVTSADVAMDALSNTFAWPLTEAYDIYDEYLNDKSAGDVDKAKKNAAIGIGFGAGMTAAVPILGKAYKAYKKLKPMLKDKFYGSWKGNR